MQLDSCLLNTYLTLDLLKSRGCRIIKGQRRSLEDFRAALGSDLDPAETMKAVRTWGNNPEQCLCVGEGSRAVHLPLQGQRGDLAYAPSC